MVFEAVYSFLFPKSSDLRKLALLTLEVCQRVGVAGCALVPSLGYV